MHPMSIEERFQIAVAKAIAEVGSPPLGMRVCINTWKEIEAAIPNALNAFDLYLYVDNSIPEGKIEFFPEPHPESWT